MLTLHTPQVARRIESLKAGAAPHWVGDGFPVRTLIAPHASARQSPYLMLDYAGPFKFGPSTEPRGVDEHPHRGFETVTVVFQGELEHRDSAGNSGRIGPGDVQWMTAGAGVLHEEKHSEAFTRQGGTLEMAQLWVNLPARHKLTKPRYQTLVHSAVPVVPLASSADGSGNAGRARVIAGELYGVRGPAETLSPVFLWDVALRAGATVLLPVPEGASVSVFVRRGALALRGTGGADLARAESMQLVTFERRGGPVELGAEGDTELLVLGGEPIEEPIAAYGPFVMNTPAEIQQAIHDLRSGRFGRL